MAVDAIILAGGYGTRLRPLTYTRPKPLLAVAGRPMIEWVIDRLPPEVKRVIVAVNWKAQALGTYLANRPAKAAGDRCEFIVVKEDEPLGTAGAVKNCAKFLTSDSFFVLNADIVSEMDLAAMMRAHKAAHAVGTIALKEVPLADVVNFGVIQPGAATPAGTTEIKGFVEKPKDPALAPSRLINAGAYLLERRILDLIPSGKMVSMEKEIFPQLIPQGFHGFGIDGPWIDVGDPKRLLEASRTLDPSFKAGKDFRLGDHTQFTGSLAGNGCTVRPSAHLDGCVLGDGVTIDVGVHLKDCIVGDGEFVRESATGARIWTKPMPAGYPASQVGNAL
ncbi:MAG: NDP-sugar synthase [Candidatus Thermoplasmatota archaeon]|mgnify:CR=1 FL=1